MEKTCIICLGDSSPLHLLACGCRVAWFHSDCESRWLSSMNVFPPSCPVCRRTVKYKIIYSFAWSTGIHQKHLWHVANLFFLESSFSSFLALADGGSRALLIPLQSSFILLYPFVFKTKHYYNFYLLIYNLKLIGYSIFFFWYFFIRERTPFDTFSWMMTNQLGLYGGIYSLCFIFTQLSERYGDNFESVNTFTHFIKERRLLHIESF
jgi:hypothetical protein